MFKCLDNLQKYLDNNMTVLLVGKHGIGKTAIVKQLFEKKFPGKWKYFSAAVMDPFLDFVGVPEKKVDEISGKSYLDLVRPKCFEDDDVEAIFMDEYNRAPKKILAATMELIQFKQINGKEFKNLKVVWAAINPDDLREYDVEKLDPAIQDRFQIQIDLPYILDKDFFNDKFGKEVAGSAIEWWSDLDNKTKDSVSPRRLEYALDVYNIKGDLKDVLPKNCNVGKLYDNLKLGSLGSRVEKLINENDVKVVKETLADINLVNYIKKNLSNPKYVNKFTEYLPEELIVQEAPNNFEMCSFIKTNSNKFDPSLIGTLDKLDCFKESAFKNMFVAMKSLFPDTKYNSNRRQRIQKVLQHLPDVNSVKVRKSDVPNLQLFINIVNQYATISTSNSVWSDDTKFNFLSKISNLMDYNSATSLGLDFAANNMFAISNYIRDYKNRQATINVSTQSMNFGTASPQQSVTSSLPVTGLGDVQQTTFTMDTFGSATV